MKAARRKRERLAVAALASAWVLAGPSAASASEAFFERVEQALTFRSDDHAIRARLGGLLDLEAYALEQPAPGLLFTDDTSLLAPRLTLTFDAQIGAGTYVFAQGRLDRRFDPTDHGAQARLDEWAARFALLPTQRLQLQVGKFATVVGNWVARHGSWRDPFITAPAAYENTMGVWDVAAAVPASKLLKWAHLEPRVSPREELADKPRELPIVWGPSYTTGVALFGGYSNIDYAVEFKNASLSSRPSTWSAARTKWAHPTVSGRVGWRPGIAWNLGLSASSGHYLQEGAIYSLAPGHDLEDYRQWVLAHDVAFAWHHWQLWAEILASRFTLPQADDATTVAWYVEAKYKFTPRIFGAVRWNQQHFGRLRNAAGQRVRWGRELTRLDVGPTFRLTAHLQFKLQYSVQYESDHDDSWSHLTALQATLRF